MVSRTTLACAAGRRGLKRGFAPSDCPKNATLNLVRQHGQHHAGCAIRSLETDEKSGDERLGSLYLNNWVSL
jgi:hypothetical protein